jgi:hypothetical protein
MSEQGMPPFEPPIFIFLGLIAVIVGGGFLVQILIWLGWWH